MNERVKLSPAWNKCSSVQALEAIVAIPVCNERDRIADCLNALSAQVGLKPYSFGVLLFLNNCFDETAEVIASLAPSMPWPMRVIEVFSEQATAGWARRKAMEAAANWLRETGAQSGVLLTTDADSRVDFDWVRRNLHHLAAGCDAVAGRISLHPAEAALLPESLHARGRLEARYEALLTEIGARLDPEPMNPWPCHWTSSGATLAVRLAAYEAIDGMPALAQGEDRAFVDKLRSAGFVVRHATDIEVVTSGRLDGRAPGGAADTMRRRCENPDLECDPRLERVDRAVARVFWRRYLRVLFAKGQIGRTWLWAPALRLTRSEAEKCVAIPSFGTVHAAIEAASARLAYRPVVPAQLPRQIRLATTMVTVLRALDRSPSAKHPNGTALFVSEFESPQIQPTLP